MFGHSDASSDQHGTVFNQFVTRLLESGKDQDLTVPVIASSAIAVAGASQPVNGSTSGPAASALAIAQIAARSKVLAACEEQKFNQFVNEALLLHMKRLERRIEELQQVESADAILRKLLFVVFWRSFPHPLIRNRLMLSLNIRMGSMRQMILATT